MNYFTKSELEIMIAIMDKMYFGEFYADSEMPKLYGKIQSMIENYCEHEVCRIDYDHQSIRCNKCKEVVE